VTGGADGSARLWDPHTGAERRRLAVDGSPVSAVAFTPDGKVLATSTAKGIRLWNPTTGAHLATLSNTETEMLEWSADGKELVSADADGVARVWSYDGDLKMSMKGHTQGVATASFSPSADRVVTTSNDHSIRVWKTATGEEITRWDTPFADARFDPSGKLLLAHSDLDVEVWKVDDEGRKPIARMKHDAEVTSARWSSRGEFVVTSSIDGTLRVWDRAGHLLVMFRDGLSVQWGAQFFDSDLFIASNGQTGAVIWEIPPPVTSFAKLARCKHYELRGNQLVPTNRPSECD
jgi:WD40 repeat protein